MLLKASIWSFKKVQHADFIIEVVTVSNLWLHSEMDMYRQVSNIRRTKSQHLKDSHTVLRLSLPNPLKPDVKSRMKM